MRPANLVPRQQLVIPVSSSSQTVSVKDKAVNGVLWARLHHGSSGNVLCNMDQKDFALDAQGADTPLIMGSEDNVVFQNLSDAEVAYITIFGRSRT